MFVISYGDKQPGHGTALVETDKTITYSPAPSFNQDIDTVKYEVCLESSTGICDSALFVIYVNRPVGVDDLPLEILVRWR